MPGLLAQTNQVLSDDPRMEWWRDARFGMFIHWGLYAIPAGAWNGVDTYGEWIRHSAKIPLETYDRFQKQFDPQKFDAREWVKMAKNAGMRYIVITTKHHDGFCMFNTNETSFNIMETPFGRDVMDELADACREEGIRLCFYYSIMDWHHPDYLPRRNWETDRDSEGASYRRYVKYMKKQLRELLKQYGGIGVIWCDGEWENTWNQELGTEIYKYVRRLQPPILVNNRVGAGRTGKKGLEGEKTTGGDFGTPEQEVPATGLPGVDWESCITMNDNWGYNKADTNYKSTKEIIRMLVDIASKGGNLLLNVGPKADGTFPLEAVQRLKQIGSWMKINGESIYGTQASPFSGTPWGRITIKTAADQNPVVYLHMFNRPESGNIYLHGCLNEPVSAAFLATPDQPIHIERDGDAVVVNLPQVLPDSIDAVIKLVLKPASEETMDAGIFKAWQDYAPGASLVVMPPPYIVAENEIFINRLKVELVSEIPGLEIRFTGDGSDPVDTSFLYTEPLEIRGAVHIKARCFKEGNPVSGTAEKHMKMVIPLASKWVEDPQPGLRYRVYSGNWDSVPDFDTTKLVHWGISSRISLDSVSEKDYFGVRYQGYIYVPEDQVYTFYLESDDGSTLSIGSRLVVDNDGLHGMKEHKGSIGLSKGYHPITVNFFEKTGDAGIKAFISSPDIEKQEIKPETLFY